MTSTILVTGANGFVGQHLVNELAARGDRVVAVARDTEPAPAIASRVDDFLTLDLRQQEIPTGVDAVVHLAGHSAVGASFDNPQGYLSENTAMLTNVCEPLVRDRAHARVLVVSTGAVYASAQSMPISEDGLVFPSSPYAVSKIAVETQADYYRGRGIATVVVRPFNHVGPGQGPGFLVPDLIKAIRTSQRVGEDLRVGNLHSSRDYSDVRDVVSAYASVLDAAAPWLSHPVLNVCSGRARSGWQILEILGRLAGLELDSVTTDEGRVRPNDPSVIVGSSDLLRSVTPWQPGISLETSLRDAWNYGE